MRGSPAMTWSGTPGRMAEPQDLIDRAPSADRRWHIAGRLPSRLSVIVALYQADIGDEVLHALAGVAGQRLREIAQHLGRHQLAQAVEIAAAPRLLDRGMDRLERAEIAIVDGSIVAAVARHRRGCGADRARHRTAGPGEGDADVRRNSRYEEQEQRPDDQQRQQPAEEVADAAHAVEQHRAEKSAEKPGQERVALEQAAAAVSPGKRARRRRRRCHAAAERRGAVVLEAAQPAAAHAGKPGRRRNASRPARASARLGASPSARQKNSASSRRHLSGELRDGGRRGRCLGGDRT